MHIVCMAGLGEVCSHMAAVLVYFIATKLVLKSHVSG